MYADKASLPPLSKLFSTCCALMEIMTELRKMESDQPELSGLRGDTRKRKTLEAS